jgi:hypothetical protein
MSNIVDDAESSGALTVEPLFARMTFPIQNPKNFSKCCAPGSRLPTTVFFLLDMDLREKM